MLERQPRLTRQFKKYETLKQASDQAKTAGVDDWRELDAAIVAAPQQKVQQ